VRETRGQTGRFQTTPHIVCVSGGGICGKYVEGEYARPTDHSRGRLARAARISCYTGHVEKARQNVTLVVDEELLLAARKVALDQRTSVNQLVREYLTALVEEPSRRRLARASLKKTFKRGLIEVGDWKWNRDDLYER
jgi:hypothetical protein